MKVNIGNTLILLAFGMLVGIAMNCGFIALLAPSGEQESIPEQELEVIGSYSLGGFLEIWKIHDNKDNVTCWRDNSGGMSCIPDHMLSP